MSRGNLYKKTYAPVESKSVILKQLVANLAQIFITIDKVFYIVAHRICLDVISFLVNQKHHPYTSRVLVTNEDIEFSGAYQKERVLAFIVSKSVTHLLLNQVYQDVYKTMSLTRSSLKFTKDTSVNLAERTIAKALLQQSGYEESPTHITKLIHTLQYTTSEARKRHFEKMQNRQLIKQQSWKAMQKTTSTRSKPRMSDSHLGIPDIILDNRNIPKTRKSLKSKTSAWISTFASKVHNRSGVLLRKVKYPGSKHVKSAIKYASSVLNNPDRLRNTIARSKIGKQLKTRLSHTMRQNIICQLLFPTGTCFASNVQVPKEEIHLYKNQTVHEIDALLHELRGLIMTSISVNQPLAWYAINFVFFKSFIKEKRHYLLQDGDPVPPNVPLHEQKQLQTLLLALLSKLGLHVSTRMQNPFSTEPSKKSLPKESIPLQPPIKTPNVYLSDQFVSAKSMFNENPSSGKEMLTRNSYFQSFDD